MLGLGLRHQWCTEEGVAFTGMQLFSNVKQWGCTLESKSGLLMRLDSRWPKFWWEVYPLLIVCTNPRMAWMMCWCLLGWGIELKNECNILVQQARKLTLNITRASPREILPKGYSCSYVGFLLKDSKHVVWVNQDVVKAKMAYLHDHTVIVSFIGEKPFPNAFNV